MSDGPLDQQPPGHPKTVCRPSSAHRWRSLDLGVEHMDEILSRLSSKCPSSFVPVHGRSVVPARWAWTRPPTIPGTQGWRQIRIAFRAAPDLPMNSPVLTGDISPESLEVLMKRSSFAVSAVAILAAVAVTPVAAGQRVMQPHTLQHLCLFGRKLVANGAGASCLRRHHGAPSTG